MEKRLGDFQLHVMLAILRLKNNAHGSTIQRELGIRYKKDVVLGSIFVTLDRLEARNLIGSYRGEPRKIRGGCARRMVRLTKKGIQELRDRTLLIKEITEALESLDSRIR